MSITVPDPELTLSETINVEGTLRAVIHRSRSQGDAVLASAAQKLIHSAHLAAVRHPEEFERVKAEVDMQDRFGLGA